MNPISIPAPVGLSDLGDLTTRGLAAFAARAARRALALYHPGSDADRAAVEHFENAVQYAESAARGEASELPAALLDELFDLADHVSQTSGYTPFAAAHAARVASRSVGGAADYTAHLELIASAYGATRVLYTAAGNLAERAVTRGLRADFDALLALRLGDPGAAGKPVDPSEAGPLGPLEPGEPAGI